MGKARLAALAKPLLVQLPDGVYRELLTDELARWVGLPRNRLEALMTGDSPQTPAHEQKPAPAQAATGPSTDAARRGSLSPPGDQPAAALSRQWPSQVPLPDTLRAAGQRGLELLCELHDLRAADPALAPPHCLSVSVAGSERPHLAQLLAEEQLIGAARRRVPNLPTA